MDEKEKNEFNEIVECMKSLSEIGKVFEKWIDAHCVEKGSLSTIPESEKEIIAYNSFYKDGIIDEAGYRAAKVKVLFISNEASIGTSNIVNDSKDDKRKIGNSCGNTAYSFKEYAERDISDNWTTKMRIKYGEMFRIILGEEINKEDWINRNKNYNKRFAMMNINKRGGFGKVQMEKYLNYIDTFKDFILKEIQLINPDIIVWCGVNTYDKAAKKLFADFEYKRVENLFATIKLNNRDVKIIKMYHTSPCSSARVKGFLNKEVYNEDNISKYLFHFNEIWESLKNK